MRDEHAGIVELAFGGAVVALLVGVCAVTAQAQWNRSHRAIEQKTISDLFSSLQVVAANPEARRRLNVGKHKDHVGRAFFEYMFKAGVLETDMLKKCVSPQSLAGDEPSDGKFVENDEAEMPQSACSYATPKIGELMKTLSKKGKDKAVVLCWDSRNWLNAGKCGAIVSWSDGESGVFLTAEEARADFDITAAQFDDPGGALFGKLAPFAFVYEEATSASAAAKVREEIKKMPSFVEVYRKKGRSWKYLGEAPPSANVKQIWMRVEVGDVADGFATLNFELTDTKGKEIEGQRHKWSDTIDLSDSIAERPFGKAAAEIEEVDAAGQKWKCRKWMSLSHGTTTNIWYCVDVPGLMVKHEDVRNDERSTLILIEYTDPK